MTRRNQSRRRRTYGRRQHEVRERRPDARGDAAWSADGDFTPDTEWHVDDTADERASYGESFGGFAR